MNQARSNELRGSNVQRTGLALVLYLELPEDEVQEWDRRCNVFAVDGATAGTIRAALADATEDSVLGLEDEAARATSLFASAGPDSQAFAVGLIEALVSLTEINRTALSGFNVYASTTIEEAQRRLTAITAGEDEVPLPEEVECILKACERFLADRNGLPPR
jgi:hypothetical protein